jgi:hypothetical protein
MVNIFATGPPPILTPDTTVAATSTDDILQMPDLSNVLITYKVSINGGTATALLDTGAQQDFINKAFTDRHKLHTVKTSNQYVRMANGLRQDASHKFLDASIDIQGL